MAFKFRLEKVARYRQKLVDEQGPRVAAAQRTVSDLQVRIVAVDEDIARHLSEFSAVDDAVISVQGLMARTMWGSHLEEMRAEFARELQVAGEELAGQIEILNDVWRDREVLTRLREKQKAVWQAAQLKQENHDMDEVGRISAERLRRSKVAT